MIGITKSILENRIPTVFTFEDLQKICPEDNVRYCQVNRAIKNKEIIRLTKGFYTLGDLFRKEPIDSEALSQRIDDKSYVSMASALRNYNWIPEAVYRCVCVTSNRNRNITNEYLYYSFRKIKQNDYSKGVVTVNYYGTPFLQATPLKALADYISWIGYEWTTLEPLFESLRIEEESLEELKSEDFDELQGNYPCYPNTEKFLVGIRKELQL